MTLNKKIWLLCCVVFSLIMVIDRFAGHYAIEAGIRAELERDAKDVRAILMATRRVYHKQFEASDLPVNDKTVGFLPAHALSRISQDFTLWSKSGLTFNNVSDQPRNPVNQADSFELEAMAWFRANPEAEDRLVEIREADGRRFYHFTAPIRIEGYCLKCHGDRATAPASIAKNYDAAYGYKEGDLRGVMSVRLPVEALRDREYAAWYREFFMRLAGYALLLLLMGFLLNRTVVTRLARLQYMADRFGAGDLTARSHEAGHDEIGALASAFNQMGDGIKHRIGELHASRERFRALIEGTSDAIYIKDAQGCYVLANGATERFVGKPAEAIIGRDDSALFSAAEASVLMASDRQIMDGGRVVTLEENLTVANGCRSVFHTTKGPLHDEAGRVVGLFGVARDVTERKQIEQALVESEDRFRQISSIVSDLFYACQRGNDGHFRIDWLGGDSMRLFGIELDELKSLGCWRNLVVSDEQALFQEKITELQPGQSSDAIFRVLHRDGAVRYLRSFARVEPDPSGGDHHRLYGAVQDFTERAELMQRFERQAHRDFLTDLINRGHFLELAEKELARVRRYGGALSIAMIDLDHFKQVNDTYGHATGDQVLKAFATVGQRVLRESDLLGRMGGEEFAILFPETSAQQAFDVADRLREAVAATDIPSLQGASIRITVSIGIASMIDAKTSVDQLLNLADGALYQAKSEGRNRTLVAASG